LRNPSISKPGVTVDALWLRSLIHEKHLEHLHSLSTFIMLHSLVFRPSSSFLHPYISSVLPSFTLVRFLFRCNSPQLSKKEKNP
jgi:hypothetical protein